MEDIENKTKLKVNPKDLKGSLIINVKLIRHKEWKMRIKIGKFLIKLASKIMWVNIKIIEEIN